MEETASVPMGLTQSKLKKYFKRALHPLLSTCSTEVICKAFPGFSSEEQKCLHRFLIKVITSLHGHIEDVFESLCDEMKVGISLDAVEQLIEEQSLDNLSSDKYSWASLELLQLTCDPKHRSNVLDVGQDLLAAKKNEIQYLLVELAAAKEHNQSTRARMELLKEGQQDFEAHISAIEQAKH